MKKNTDVLGKLKKICKDNNLYFEVFHKGYINATFIKIKVPDVEVDNDEHEKN